ncbi:CYTH domain-containing protein [Halopseudomonas pachastrellae]|nr:CYTH domain-containing protein [Halopseudomonas pachastrellae]
MALRLRRDGDTYIQTLKSRGQSVAGLSERNEWDWYLKTDALDPALLDDSCWPASLAELDKQQLQPLFTTDFERTRALLRWSAMASWLRWKRRWTAARSVPTPPLSRLASWSSKFGKGLRWRCWSWRWS